MCHGLCDPVEGIVGLGTRGEHRGWPGGVAHGGGHCLHFPRAGHQRAEGGAWTRAGLRWVFWPHQPGLGFGQGVRWTPPPGLGYVPGTFMPPFTLGQTDGFDYTKSRLHGHRGRPGQS